MRGVYSLTVFLGSWLLFLVEPFIAKRLLPTFGGSPLVWNTAMLFFQFVLLLGYLYAHLSTTKLGVRKQAWVQLGVIAVAAAFLPPRVPAALLNAYANTGERGFFGQPTVALLAMLFVAVGLPFFVLSSGASVLQRWYSRTSAPDAQNPYFLYRASNWGSMIALLMYPLVLEPRLALAAQAWMWAALYVVLIAFVVICARYLWKAEGQTESIPAEQAEQDAPDPTTAQKALWVFLAACPSAALLGVTSYITTNIAPMPLLWVVPLALYLLTFIVAFADKPLIPRIVLKIVLPLALIPAIVFYEDGAHDKILWQVGSHLLAFLAIALACHTEIGRSRPHAKHLTGFYLWISVGGVIGGLFSSIVAPLVFAGQYEYPVALAAGAAALFLAWKLRPRPLDYAFGVVLAVLFFLTAFHSENTIQNFEVRSVVWACSVLHVHPFGIPLVMYAYPQLLLAGIGLVYSAWRPQALAGVLACTFALFIWGDSWQGKNFVIYASRSFYGTREVQWQGAAADIQTHAGGQHKLFNGNILHGLQDRTPGRTQLPLSYYTKTSGIGLLMSAFGDQPRMDRFAVVGLGTGTMAAYGRPNQTVDFYELDPSVEKIARNNALFSFVQDSKAQVNVILGDARLRLREAPEGQYGAIVLDAFSSDAIPTHLLTKEAVEMYMRKLRPDGVLAVHVSNRYLKLTPVVASACQVLGIVAYERIDDPTPPDDHVDEYCPSDWILVARNASVLGALADGTEFQPVEPAGAATLWTDDFSNVLEVLNLGV